MNMVREADNIIAPAWGNTHLQATLMWSLWLFFVVNTKDKTFFPVVYIRSLGFFPVSRFATAKYLANKNEQETLILGSILIGYAVIHIWKVRT